MAAKVWVRVNPKTGLALRMRAGQQFTKEWLAVELGNAERKAIDSDAYLEVSEIDPGEPVQTEQDAPTDQDASKTANKAPVTTAKPGAAK